MAEYSTKYVFWSFIIFVAAVIFITTITMTGWTPLDKLKVSLLIKMDTTSDLVRSSTGSTRAKTVELEQQEPTTQYHKSTMENISDLIRSSAAGSTEYRDEPVEPVPEESTQQYHKIYPVNCSAIFSGNQAMINLARSMVTVKTNGKMKPKENLIPDDKKVAEWARNCEEYKHGRKYFQKPLSVEEAEFPIAYSMVVYKNAAQVERLLRAIYQPQNVYCIHVDKKSSTQFKKAIRALIKCFDNVFVASKLEDVEWGGYSAVLADLHCIEDLQYHPVQWKYLLNLCGMDFPLKTNYEIVQQLKAYNNHNCIEGYKRKDTQRERHRFDKSKGKAPHDIFLYGGDTYIAATREFVNFTIHDEVAKDFLNWLKDVRVADEYYTNALNRLPYAPGGHIKPSMDCNVRFRKWTHNRKFKERPKCIGKVANELCLFSAGYLKHFYRTPQLFVNKLDYESDPIAIQCMEELLDYRSYHPEDFKHWQSFPITDYYWQND